MLNKYRAPIFRFIECIKEATQYKNPVSQFQDALLHKLRLNTRIADYYRFEFYKNNKSWEEKSRFISLAGSMYWPYETNSLKYNSIYTNKYIQKCLIQGLRLPTPNLITTIGEAYEIRTEKQLKSLLATIDRDIAIKPISGTHGNGILILSRSGNAFISGDTRYSVEDIWCHVSRDLKRGFLIEEKISNAGYIAETCPGCLNTFRVVTINLQEQGWHPLVCYLKIGSGNSQVDNIRAGGILLLFDDSGKCTRAYDYRRCRFIEHHPETGVKLLGVEIKDYPEVIIFALKASEKLGFMGTIGWDIAVTDDGLSIIEANGAWGANAVQKTMGRGIITDEVARRLKKRRMFCSWDKTKMYPGFHKKKHAAF